MLQVVDLIFGGPRSKEVSIHGIGQDMNLLLVAVEFVAQDAGRVLGADDDGIGQVVYELLQISPWPLQNTVWRQEAVVHHLTGEAALKVEYQRHAPQATEEEANQGALVEMSVDDVRLSPHSPGQGPDGEEDIEGEFVEGRAYLVPVTPGDAGCAYDAEPFDIFTVAIGAHSGSMAEPLQRKDLVEDSDVAAVVGKEGCWGEDQDLELSMSSSFFRRGRRRIAASCRLASLDVAYSC